MSDNSSNASSHKPHRSIVLPYKMFKSDEETENRRGLLPEEVKAAIPPLHTQDPLPDEEVSAYARLTCEELGFTWFVLELHEDGETFSGYWIDQEKEQFGYFSLAHMQDQIPFALAYDGSFIPERLVDAVRQERRTREARGERLGLKETDSLAEHRAYYYAARYNRSAKQIFTTVRDIISQKHVDLSVYHLQLDSYPHVVVIGDRPPERVHTRIMEALKEGTMTLIPYDLLLQLYARKLEKNENREKQWKTNRSNP